MLSQTRPQEEQERKGPCVCVCVCTTSLLDQCAAVIANSFLSPRSGPIFPHRFPCTDLSPIRGFFTSDSLCSLVADPDMTALLPSADAYYSDGSSVCKQHVLDLYCSKGKNCCYRFYWPSFGMAYGNPRFGELGKVLTKVALERSRMVLCSPDSGAHAGNEYWRTPLDKLTLTSIHLPDDAICVPLSRKTPIGKPGWGSMLSVVDGGLAPVPWEDLDPAMVQEIQRGNSGYTLDVLKNQLRPRVTVETTPGGDEYVVSDTVAPSSPCRVPNPDVVSECGLSELPSSIHSDDET